MTSSDTRLWREAVPEAFEMAPVELMVLQLSGRLEEWADDLRDRLLNDSVQHGGNAQGALTPGGFWNPHPQHRCRAIGTLFKG